MFVLFIATYIPHKLTILNYLFSQLLIIFRVIKDKSILSTQKPQGLVWCLGTYDLESTSSSS